MTLENRARKRCSRTSGLGAGENAVIRQAISCDICAAEKKQTNHWFVAYELNGELRIGGWSSRNRLRAGSKHLCGQTCLHKLVDDFMARSIAVRAHKGEGDAVDEPVEIAEETAPPLAASKLPTDTSLTSSAAFVEEESSARLLTPPEPRSTVRIPASLVRMPERVSQDDGLLREEDAVVHSSPRNWHAEAWERERERELRSSARLRSNR